MKLNNKITNIIAVCLLAIMFSLAFFSMLGDATTMDELAHIPSGYSYIVKQDMRLNPEHPPLLKDLAGFSVWLGSKITKTPINFPEQSESWTEDINGQWDFGRALLYQSGNNADQIVFFGRLPMLFVMLLLGFYVFRWARELYGNKAGLLALFLYSFSPAFLANGRLVTTDVGAAAAFFIAIYYFVKFLRSEERILKHIFAAGIALAIALLTKFSLALLAPCFVILIIAWIFKTRTDFFKPIFGFVLIGVIAMILIWPVYQFHTWNYPVERQQSDTQIILETFGKRWLADPVIWMSDKPILRPYAQFFLGLLMVVQRAAGGNTTYFMGEVSRFSWPLYFPIVFLIKVPLALLTLILLSFLISIFSIKKLFKRLDKCFAEFALLIFFAIYWYSSVTSNLNIGVRHVLPTFPVIYILISGQIAKIKIQRKMLVVGYWTMIVLLLFWYAFSAVRIYPSFLAHFNELAGGPDGGHKFVTDSNLDWGQDLKRLTNFVEKNKIDIIYLDYFGGDSPSYRLGQKFYPWWGDRDPSELPPDSWLAVSATFLQGGQGASTPELYQKTGYYNWLKQYEPTAIIGHSIFVYHL